MDNLSSLSDKQSLKLGPTPTPLEGFKLGVGQKVKIVNYRFGKVRPRDGSPLLLHVAAAD